VITRHSFTQMITSTRRISCSLHHLRISRYCKKCRFRCYNLHRKLHSYNGWSRHSKCSRNTEFPPRERHSSTYQSLKTFHLPKATSRKYTTQFADLYYARLTLLKSRVEAVGEAAWKNYKVRTTTPRLPRLILAAGKRDRNTSGESTRRATGPVMLGCGDSVHGYAFKT
jgi:hypothetical protein